MWWLDVVLYPRLIGLAAADEGLYDTPDIRAFRKWKRDEVLADQVRSLAVADIEVSEEEIRQRYDANPGSFRLEGHVRTVLFDSGYRMALHDCSLIGTS